LKRGAPRNGEIGGMGRLSKDQEECNEIVLGKNQE